MAEILARGRAVVVGSNVNTDYIVPSHRKKESIDPEVLKAFVFEDYRRELAGELQGGAILFAGENFGCGSAMEVAVTVLRAAGVRAVVAPSFARTFKRNAVNNGLLVLTAESAGLQSGGAAEIHAADGALSVHVDGRHWADCAFLPAFLIGVIRAGGLAPYLRAQGGFPAIPAG